MIFVQRFRQGLALRRTFRKVTPVILSDELVRKRFIIPAEAGIQPIYKFCKNGR
jgi:hypothetical protein